MEAPATLVLVGGHPGEVEGEHPADAVRRLDLGDAVRLAGWVAQEDLPEILAAADLLVLASARESFGQVLVEAMACGIPPVAAAAPGPRGSSTTARPAGSSAWTTATPWPPPSSMP